MEILAFIFWFSFILLIYPYLIFPVLLAFLTEFFGQNKELAEGNAEWPMVSFLISAYNEAESLAQKLENTLELDYPEAKLQVLVISDASDDGTDDIVQEYGRKDSRIQLVRQETRRGKTAGLNLAMPHARGDIVIFSDANAMFKQDALYELVKYFVNPEIGYVMGAALYQNSQSSEASQSESLYWKFELFLKRLESQFYSVVGGDGAIYAIRKPLYQELDDDDINDFGNPLQIVASGYRGIFNPAAICYEDAGETFAKEFERKRRIVNRSWRALTKYLNKFKPLKQSRFLFTLFSHKVIRWFSMALMGIFFLSTWLLMLSSEYLFYELVFTGQLLFLGAALYGFFLDWQHKSLPKWIYLPYYYLVVHLAAFLGIYDAVRGIKHTTWEHIRRS